MTFSVKFFHIPVSLRQRTAVYFTNVVIQNKKSYLFKQFSRAGNSLIGFLSESLLFCEKNERMSDSLKKSDSLDRSFLVSDLSESLMVAHLS